MAATRKQNVGLYEGWIYQEEGWGDAMNDNLRRLDVLVAPRVISVGLNNPPGAPADGDAYVIGNAPTGAWTTHGAAIARYYATGAVWEFITPLSGWQVFSISDSVVYQYLGGVWKAFSVFDAYSYAAGNPTSNAILLRVPLVRATVFPANFAGSYGSASAAATASTAFSIKKNGVTVGTATFAPAETACTFTSSGGVAVTFAAGDILSVHAPASADATLSDVGFGLTGTR